MSNGIADNGQQGGGAINNAGALSVTAGTFANNSNRVTSGTSGGAVQNSGTMTVSTTLYTGNVAMEGGAVFDQNIANITQSTFTDNAATIYGGGAILNAFGTTTVAMSTFVGSTGPGGGVVDNDTTINISDSACDIGAYELIVVNSDTQPPTTPGGLAASSNAAGGVVLSWNASTDNVGFIGYTVYRNGSPLRKTNGGTTGYTDTSAAAKTTYTHSVDAYDAAGNHSAQSTALAVTTTAPPPVAARWVQGGTAATGTPVTSVPIQLSAAVSAGNLLVGWFGQYDSSGRVQVSDNVNSAWTRASPSTTFSSGGGDVALFYVQNAAAAPAGVTVTISSAAGTYLQGSAAEYAGVAVTGSLDQVAVASGTGTAANSGATGSVAAGELLFSALMTGTSPGGATANNGLLIHDHNTDFSVDDADSTTTAGTQQSSWALQQSADWYEVAAVFHVRSGQ